MKKTILTLVTTALLFGACKKKEPLELPSDHFKEVEYVFDAKDIQGRWDITEIVLEGDSIYQPEGTANIEDDNFFVNSLQLKFGFDNYLVEGDSVIFKQEYRDFYGIVKNRFAIAFEYQHDTVLILKGYRPNLRRDEEFYTKLER